MTATSETVQESRQGAPNSPEMVDWQAVIAMQDKPAEQVDAIPGGHAESSVPLSHRGCFGLACEAVNEA